MARNSTRFYLYNETFKHYLYDEWSDKYGWPRSRAKAEALAAELNQYMGGHWILHTRDQFNEWWYENCPKADPANKKALRAAREAIRVKLAVPLPRCMFPTQISPMIIEQLPQEK